MAQQTEPVTSGHTLTAMVDKEFRPEQYYNEIFNK